MDVTHDSNDQKVTLKISVQELVSQQGPNGDKIRYEILVSQIIFETAAEQKMITLVDEYITSKVQEWSTSSNRDHIKELLMQ